jgi:regulator of sirC expression with transglutaminase-like and TPR domain
MNAPAGETWSRQRFADLLARPEEAIDLAEGALLIACEEYPELELDRYLAQLDEMGAALATRLAPRAGAEAAAATLNEYLFEEQGFRGNAEAYYDPRNSFLNEVLDRRVGIPITLSAVYMEVGRRAGVPVFGVGLPGHFVVKLEAAGDEVLVDPFHAGAILTREHCQERLDRIFGGRVKMEPRMLDAVTPRQMLERMLRNLKAIYAKEEDHQRALRVLELLLRIPPTNLDDLRDRGLVYAALDCYGLAVRDLEAYLSSSAPAKRTKELMSALASLRGKAARVN